MEDTHYSEDELIERLYGVGRPDFHLDLCPDCAARWRQLTERRRERLGEREISPDLLAGQRRAIRAKLARPEPAPGWASRPLVALALAVLMGLALALQGPVLRPEAVMAAVEARFFEDVFREVSRPEPRAVAPVYALFETKGEKR
ncbi:MAG: hypothetical protein HYR60_17190 [Acidobacteria bacterium]|nr:hypothetical protein [Acidobacteriota bacterium]